MNPGNGWMATSGMPPLGFGVIMPQPGSGGVGNPPSVPPSQMPSSVAQVQLPVAGQEYPNGPWQFQQFGIAQMNRTAYPQQQPPPKWLVAQRQEEEKWLKRQQFDQQRQRLKEFESRKKKGSITADAMIQDIFNRERHHYTPHQMHLTKEPERSRPPGGPGMAAPPDSPGGAFPPLALPQWLENPARVPRVYQAAAELGGAGPGAAWVDTGKAHSLLLRTGLPPPVLGVLWEAVNRTCPGRLLVTEFWALLALVACTQQGHPVGGPDPGAFLAALLEPVIPFIDHPTLGVGAPGEGSKASEEASTAPLVVPPTAGGGPSGPRDPCKVPGPPHLPLIRNLPTLGASPPGTRAVSPPAFQGEQSSQDDDFADFQSAAPPPPPEGDGEDRYAAFRDLAPSLIVAPLPSSFGEGVGGSSESSTYVTASASADTSNDGDDDDFGEFVGPAPPIAPPIEGSNPAVETQSVASLELPGLELTVNLDTAEPPFAVPPPPLGAQTTVKGDDADDDTDLESEFRSLRLETPATADPGAPVSADRYGSIRVEDSPGGATSREMELWRRGLEGCLRLLKEGASLLSPLGSDPTLLEQVLDTSQMQGYLTDLGEVRRVCLRIEASHRRYSGSNPDVDDLIAAGRQAWCQITTTLGDLVHKVDSLGEVSVEEAPQARFGPLGPSESCGVCLNSSGDASLVYGGRSYHPPCANLWLNVVDLTLPAPSRTRPTLL